MSTVFADADPLLRSVGMVMLYFHLFRVGVAEGWTSLITRQALVNFEKLREKNRVMAEENLPSASYDLIEFDRYSQSPNDLYAVKFRLQILLQAVVKKNYPIEEL